MEPADRDPKDVDAKLSAESMRLVREMNALIERGRLILGHLQRAAPGTAGIPATMPAIPGTLGAVLYAGPIQPSTREEEWVSLLRSVAARNHLALHALYERAESAVSTLLLQILGQRDAAEESTVEVFHDVWRKAAHYDAAEGTVVAWIMNLARARAIAARRGARGTLAGEAALPPQARLATRIAAETGGEPVLPTLAPWAEPAWRDVAPGIAVKLLASDAERHRVSMLVRLAPGTDYPPHEHAGVEELHLLEGELWIDERKLRPGDYNRAEPGTADSRVWSETGCCCVLVTSTRDILR